jgi:hypothetical protein
MEKFLEMKGLLKFFRIYAECNTEKSLYNK